jgi:hypothetical protein
MNMSATQSRTAPAERVSQAERSWEADQAVRHTASNATPPRFVTSGTPQDASSSTEFSSDSSAWQRTSLRENCWPHPWSAADSGERNSDPDVADADGGENAESGSSLSGLMLERFDDDERWRELARSGRAL